jgi:hypothetical protein
LRYDQLTEYHSIKANEKNTVSELKILSEDKAEKVEDEKPVQGSNLEPAFAGTTTNISCEADRGTCLYEYLLYISVMNSLT